MNRKRRGELSELAFLYKATGLGFSVSKPYGESSPYDLIVENRGHLSKVQVKSTSYLHRPTGGYQANSVRRVSGVPTHYCYGDLDFFAFHVIPRDAWYIVPLEAVGTSGLVLLHADKPWRDERFGRYREAWHLLDGLSDPADIRFTFNIDACADPIPLRHSFNPESAPARVWLGRGFPRDPKSISPSLQSRGNSSSVGGRSGS